MKILVLTTEPVSPDQLRAAVAEDVDPADCEVMIVAPALHENALRFWFSDADEAIDRAETVRRQSVEKLGAEGVAASADTGEGDPLDAVIDALQTFKADRIVIFSHPEGEQLYREAVDGAELEERFGIPVQRVELASGSSS